MLINLQILGTAKDLRTHTIVVYGQMPIPDYLKWVSDSFDAFEIQRKRTWHPAYQRMKADVSAGALLPTITLTVLPERVPKLLDLIRDDDFALLAGELGVPGRVYILDGLQRSFILQDLEKEGHRFHPEQTIHLEIWLEPNIHHFIYRVLVLNSAHQPMSLRHRFKLIFLTLKNRLETDIPGLVLYRKVPGLHQVRTSGMYVFDQVITSFLCYLMKTPEISRDNVEAQATAMNEIFESTAREMGCSFEEFKTYLKHYKNLDQEICRIYPVLHGLPGGNEWIGNENVMKAFFTSVAKHTKKASQRALIDQALISLQAHVESARVGEDPLGLVALKEVTDRINPRKVNVGYATRSLLLAGFECFFTQGGQKPLGQCWDTGWRSRPTRTY
ncbi:MAG: hypothetical protein JRI99_03995 [Deltaproteobacteria bacterium]|nr:hypothetical protein [Deltaproteobacteria bacterium]